MKLHSAGKLRVCWKTPERNVFTHNVQSSGRNFDAKTDGHFLMLLSVFFLKYDSNSSSFCLILVAKNDFNVFQFLSRIHKDFSNDYRHN